MFKTLRQIVLLFSILITSFPLLANPVLLEPTHEQPSLAGHLSWLNDAQQLSFEQIVKAYQNSEFVSIPIDEISAGYQHGHTIWVHFSVKRDLTAGDDWWLAIDNDPIDIIDLYIEQNDGGYAQRHGGRALPFKQREVFWRAHAFKLTSDKQGEIHIFLRAQSVGSLRLPLQLWQGKDFQRYRTEESLGYGVFFGAVNLVLLFSVFRALYYRSRVDACYSGYVFGINLVYLVALGWCQQLGCSDNLQLRISLHAIGAVSAGISIFWFLLELVEWPTHWRRILTKIAQLISVSYLVSVALVWVFFSQHLSQWVIGVSTLFVLFTFSIASWAAFQAWHNARVYVLAFLPFFFFTGLSHLGIFGIIQNTGILRDQLLWSIVFHSLALTAVILYRELQLRKRTQESLQIAATTFETPHEAIVITDVAGNLVQVNHFFERVTGYDQSEVLGKSIALFDTQQYDFNFYQQIIKILHTTGLWSGELWIKRKNGGQYLAQLNATAVKDACNQLTHFVAAFRDISEIKKTEELLHNLAFYDALTLLPNRQLLITRLALAVASAAQNKHYTAVLFLNVDNFKQYNDTQGQHAGDRLLVQISHRIQSCLASTNTLARLGADEFVIVLENLDVHLLRATRLASETAEIIRVAVGQPYLIDQQEFHLYSSIGIVLFNDDFQLTEDLLKQASIALSAAKKAGGNRVRFFNPDLLQQTRQRAALETNLHDAIIKQQLQLFYQIQVDQNRRPIGAEALLRWRMSNGEWCSPADFIPVAEQSDLILNLGAWVLETACQQLVNWSQDEYTKDLVLAINISAKQFKQDYFIAHVKSLIQRYGIVPKRLKFELTESLALENLDAVIVKMQEIKRVFGIKLSLDDFGTGFSSLSYLKRLPVDQIKIDQSFVKDLTIDTDDAMMVKTIIDMANNFGHEVIAEGVETEAQLSFLRQYGCKSYQGYLFGRPMPIEEFDKQVALLSKKLS